MHSVLISIPLLSNAHFNSSALPSVLWVNVRFSQFLTQQWLLLLWPLLFLHLGTYAGLASTLVTSCLHGRHTRELKGTFIDSTCAWASRLFHSFGKDMWLWQLQQSSQEDPVDGCVKASSRLLLLCFDMTKSETNFAIDSFVLHIHGFDCTYRFFCVATQDNSGGS